jgi:hypothetical protein
MMLSAGLRNFRLKARNTLTTCFQFVLNIATDNQFRAWDILILIAYAITISFIAGKHEPWSDEAYPWLIARDAGFRDFFNIMLHNYDRHPQLFHLILVPFAKLGFPYYTQAILNLGFAIAGAGLFMIWAPFPRLTKVLFLFSFYMAYEYAVITRPYMLAILLMFLIAVFYRKRFDKPVLYGTFIFLLFQTEHLCFGFASALVLLFAFELFKNKKLSSIHIIALALMALGGVAALLQVLMIPQNHMDYGKWVFLGYPNLLHAWTKSLFPFVNFFSNKLIYNSAYAVAILTFIFAFLSFIKKPAILLILALSYCELMYVFLFKHVGDLRHYGFLLITLLFAFWVSGQYDDWDWLKQKFDKFVFLSSRLSRKICLLLVTLSLLVSLRDVYFAYLLEYHLLFSGGKQMAELMNSLFNQHHLKEQNFVIAANHSNTSGILPYLKDFRFWSPCTRKFQTYFLATKEMEACNQLTEIEAIERARNNFNDLSKVLFLFTEPAPFQEVMGYKLVPVISMDGYKPFGYQMEKFYLYRLIKI